MFTLSDMAACFKPYLGQVSNGVNTHVGSQALETLSKRIAMGLEDVNGSVVEGDLKETTKAFVMACEAAATDLSKYQAISYSSALKHKDVIGIEVNTTNFTTHFSKKNYDIAMENIKNYLLIGASVAVVAGIGYFIYKMLSVKDEKKTKGPEIVANNKEIQKAKEYFIDIDLSALPKELQDKYIEIVRKESNEQLVRVAKDEIFIKQGFLAEVSSVCHNASFTNLEAFCFGRKENTWVIDLYNRHHKQFIDNTKFLADAIEAYVDGSKSIDILDIDFGATVVRMDEARKKRLSDVKELMDTIGLEGSNLCFADVVDHFSRDPDFGAVEFFKLIKEPTVTPSASAFGDFNKAREEMVIHGKRLEKMRGELDKIMSSNKDGLQFSGNSDLIDKLKWEVDEMTAMRGFVVRETKALATSYSYIALAAKQYAVRVNAIVEELLDDGMKKDYRAQLKKAAMALPNRRMATEDIHEDYLPYGEMGLESWNQVIGAVALIGLTFFMGYGLGRLIGVFKKTDKVQEVAGRTAEEIAKSKADSAAAKVKILEFFGDKETNGFKRSLVQVVTLDTALKITDAVTGTNSSIDSLDNVSNKIKEVIEKAKSGKIEANTVTAAKNTIISSVHHTVDKWLGSVQNEATYKVAKGHVEAFKKAVGDGSSSTDIKEAASHLTGFIRDFDIATHEFLNVEEALAEVNKNYSERWVSLSGNSLAYIKKAKMPDADKLKHTFEHSVPAGIKEDELKKLISENAELKDFKDFTKAMMDTMGTAINSMVNGWVGFTRDVTILKNHLNKKDKEPTMATEGLEEIYGAFSMPAVRRADHLGDGTEQSDLQSEQYLVLPEYEQAGYRFDPREGSEGANLMAMESWSTGAKVAIGIAAAVAILGIGALIASTLIKRASTAADRHSGKEQDKQAIEKAAVIDSNIARLEDRWKKILIKARSINDLKTVHPQFDQIEQDIHAVFRRLNNKSVVVNGVEVPAMQEVLESFGDKRGAIVRSILATHMGDIPTPFCLSGLNGRYSQAVLNFHQEVIVGTLEKMRANVDPAKIKSYIDMWWKSGDADLINEMLTDSNRTLGEQQSHVDAYWLSGGSNEFMDNKIHRSNPMTVMNAASTSCEKLSGFIVKLKNLVETYETPDVLIKEFEKAASEAKGRGDETTVILNKMAEFKPIFAQYVRVIRYEMELIEEMMGVKDRLLKAFTRFYQDNAQELKDLDIKLIGLENQDWFK